MQRQGFTLLETLLAIAILGGVTLVLAQSFFATSRGSAKSEIVSDVKQSGDFAVRIIEQMIRATSGVTSACSSSGFVSSSITLNNSDGGTTTFGCIYDNTNAISRVASSSAVGTVDYLTPTNVTLGGSNCGTSSLVFTCTSFPGQPSAIKVQFSLSQRGAPSDQFQRAQTSFQTTVNVRN